MKKIILLITITLYILSTNVNAQVTDTTICYDFSTPTDSIPTTMEIHKYDTDNNLILYVKYNWDNNVNDWIGNYKYKKAYNTNGLITTNEKILIK